MRSNLYTIGSRKSHLDNSAINIVLPAILAVGALLGLLFAF